MLWVTAFRFRFRVNLDIEGWSYLVSRALSKFVGSLCFAAVLVALPAMPAFSGQEPGVHALTGARIVQAPGQVIESGTLVIRDGLIEAVGAEVEIPAEARIWELEGASLYPGLIESFYPLSLPTPKEDEAVVQGGHENPLVTPERSVFQHAYEEDAYAKLQQAGFTTAVLVPKDGLFRGRSVLVNLGDGGVGAQVLDRDLSQVAQLATSSDGAYPGSLMGSIALFRQTMLDARWHADAQRAFAANPRQLRPEYNSAWDALSKVATGKEPIVLESRDPQEIHRLLALVNEFDLDAILVGNGREYLLEGSLEADQIRWILPVSLPKAPTVDEDHPEKADLMALRHWDQAPENPQRLLTSGATVAFTSYGSSDAKKMHEHLAKAMERGLTADQALASLTTVPAKMWGIADRAGTLEVGKMANLVVTEGDLFTEKVKITALWIDGRHTELKEIKPPTVDPIGSWDITIDAGPGGQLQVSVAFTGTVESLDGSVSTPQGSLAMLDATVSGDSVEFSIDSTPLGMPGTISFVMSIDGDACSGTGVAPQGSFTFKGDRVSGPNPEVSR